MACASCGGRNSRTIAQQHAARQAARSGGVAGATSEAPLTLGEADGSDVVRVRVLRAVEGMRAGSAQYVTGSEVRALIASGSLVDISGIGQRRRQWRVGPYTYTSHEQAQRVGAAKGLEVIEVA